jgi:DNA-directed RNA polymerase specialized sigma24 family protein
VDPNIVESARSGDREHLEALLRTIWPHAYRVSYAIVAEDALAQDAAQDACAMIYLRIGQLRSVRTFTSWFYRIVSRAATDAYVRNRRASERALSADFGLHVRFIG